MLFSILVFLLLAVSFTLITLVAFVTGFYQADMPSGMVTLILYVFQYGSVVAVCLMLIAGLVCTARGKMDWTRMRRPVLCIVWCFLMIAMMKVGFHAFDVWGSSRVSRFALFMGGIVAPMTGQILLLCCNLRRESHPWQRNLSHRRGLTFLAAVMVVSLAIGATTLWT